MLTDDVIRVARVPQRLAGTPRLRQGMEQWLAGCDPARHGMLGDAIVLVRRLSTRWDVVLARDPAQRYACFAALLTGAQRATTAGADAEVVWFADEAELLACIARDQLSGALGERWWWRVLRPELSSPGASLSAALGHWLQAPRQMPRAVQRLGEARAPAWLASLGKAGQAQMLEALGRAYALVPELRDWVLEGQLPTLGLSGKPSAPPSRPMNDGAAPAASAPALRAARLHRLIVALSLDARAAATLPALQALAVSDVSPAPVRTRRLATHQRSQHEAGIAAAVSPTHWRDRVEAAGARVRPEPAVSSGARAALQQQTAVPHSQQARAVARPSSFMQIEPAALTAPAASAAASVASSGGDEALVEAPPRTLLQTRHGGLLFLLNAALQLSLYGDFTMPQHRGLDCSPWRFLLLAGRAWCGPAFRRDPIWAWLRHRSAGSRQAVPRHVWPELHARLAEALDDGHSGVKARQHLRAMLSLPARLQDAGEHVNLHFALAELPLAVRLAGLDRDPGWIPAAGCDVRFHFD